MRFVACLLCVAVVAVTWAAPAAPAAQTHAELEQSTLLQINPRTYLMSAEEAMNTRVPCKFCNQTMVVLLELCKATAGRSTDHVEDFLTKCTEIGGLHPEKLDMLTKTCSDTELEQRRVNMLYERRLHCSKIYGGLLSLYNPYDPCLQIRGDFQKHHMTVCRSGMIDCADDTPPPRVDFDAQPPIQVNDSIAFHKPPRACQDYVSEVIQRCTIIKNADYHAKSNLDGWCNNTYADIFQKLGCKVVVREMIERDKRMDVCSGLAAFPIKSVPEFCEETLNFSLTSHVPVPEFHDYMKVVTSLHKEIIYQRALNGTTALHVGQIM